MPRISAVSLPLKHSYAREYAASIAIAILMFLASIAGILYGEVFYPIDELSVGFVSTDLLNLAVGFPILLLSMWLTRRGHLVGLLCWPGALLYVLYIYFSYLALPMRVLLIPHLLLIALSAYTTIAVMANIKSEKVRQRISEVVPAKTTGYILVVIAILVFAYQFYNIATSIINKAPPDRMTLVQWIDDLVIGCPAILGGGWLLLRRKELGYAAGMGLLLVCSLLFVGVIPAMIFNAISDNMPVDVIGILIVLVTGMICFIPFVLFVRGVAKTKPAEE